MEQAPFTTLGLPEPLMRAIDDLGFTAMTPIQQLVLPRTLKGEDVAAQGRTGTGKTAAFLITIIHRLLTRPPKRGRKPHHLRAVVLAPTRELVIQIGKDAAALLKYTDLRCHTVYGGVDYDKQQRGFEGGVDLLIGTPGRLIDYHKKRCFSLSKCEVAVIDEADRMFDLGFIRDLRYVMRRLPPFDRRQALLFSATLSYRVMELAYEHMNNPEKLRAEEGDITAVGVRESLYHTAMEEKLPLLIHLLRRHEVRRGMIFVNEKRTGERVARRLAQYGFKVGILSGDVRQKRRMRILQDFTAGRLHLLVATDVASRGIHVDDVTHVFNYDLPEDPENYVHRIGRTARAGNEGVAISFSCERFCFGLPDIEGLIGHSIPVEVVDPAWLEVGPPVDRRATAVGLKREDRAERRDGGDRKKSGGGRPSRRRGSGGGRRGRAAGG
ncbi:MAG: DEAD/DEAH box helicase [Zetaproteobacteria bacterium]|nr:MAG: DEAD/DEAH box helicase [Zetaproteobacteria bacterium]